MTMTWTLDPVCVATLRGSLALLFVVSAARKLRAPSAFRAALTGYDLLPAGWVGPAANVVIGAEMMIGVGLLIPSLSASAALAGALMLAVYAAAIAVNLGRGRADIDCGCGGPAHTLPLTWLLLVRNLLLINVAAIALVPSTARALHAFDVVVVASAVTTFSLLYVAFETALANAARGHAQALRGTHDVQVPA